MNKKTKKKNVFKVGKHYFIIEKRSLIVGVLNVTPDSFYDGGRYNSLKKAINRAVQIEKEGADILDIGGESSRPGANPVSTNDELKRVIPVIEKIRDKIKIPVSIDTYKSEVAEAAIKSGVEMVNDISSLRMDKRMVEIIAKYNISICLMHMKGSPHTMQKRPCYEDVVVEIINFFRERTNFCIRHGIKRDKIVIDPGIGFGKTLSHNLKILKNIDKFKSLGYPVLLGVSRKSFIGHILGLGEEERLEGSLGAGIWGLIKGADILRVHDVLETKRAAIVVDTIKDVEDFTRNVCV